jgi:hypothetical protein
VALLLLLLRRHHRLLVDDKLPAALRDDDLMLLPALTRNLDNLSRTNGPARMSHHNLSMGQRAAELTGTGDDNLLARLRRAGLDYDGRDVSRPRRHSVWRGLPGKGRSHYLRPQHCLLAARGRRRDGNRPRRPRRYELCPRRAPRGSDPAKARGSQRVLDGWREDLAAVVCQVL